MATHLRQQFLTRLATATLASLTTTGTRVEVGRVRALPADAQPTLLLDLGPEQISAAEILSGRNRIVERALEIIVRGAVKVSTSYLETLNAIALEVETAIAGDQSLGGLSKAVQLSSIDEPELDGSGDKITAFITLRFNVLYAAALNAPETAR
jgi:hypothetical protein